MPEGMILAFLPGATPALPTLAWEHDEGEPQFIQIAPERDVDRIAEVFGGGALAHGKPHRVRGRRGPSRDAHRVRGVILRQVGGLTCVPCV